MAFRNFLNSNRWKGFANSFGRHSNRVAQQDFNAHVVDYIFELEKQIAELEARLDEVSGEAEKAHARRKKAFDVYQGRYSDEKPRAKKPQRRMGVTHGELIPEEEEPTDAYPWGDGEDDIHPEDLGHTD